MKKQSLIVTAPVANLRKEPIEGFREYVFDDLQETQLLYNECLICKDEIEDWYYVEAVEQKKIITQDNWQGYPGWVKKTSVMPIDIEPAFNAVVKKAQTAIKKGPLADSESLFTLLMGTRLVTEDERNDEYYKTNLSNGQKGWIRKADINILAPMTDITYLRKSIVETARLLLGTPYFWGGRSANVPAVEGVLTGVDCSSLTNLACRVNWLDIPRDAHDQWRVFAPSAFDKLQSADLIFVSAEDTYDKITHVMIYLAGGEFIEALETGGVVTINTFINKFGLTLHEAATQGFVVNKRKIYFGSVLDKGGEK